MLQPGGCPECPVGCWAVSPAHKTYAWPPQASEREMAYHVLAEIDCSFTCEREVLQYPLLPRNSS